MFENIDFKSLALNENFKEDSVRETIILPILKELGWQEENIVRSKSLEHPYLKIGSKNRPITLIPDYVFAISGCYAWVLDAKAPNQEIVNCGNVEQVYSYAAHPEIRSNYFALCNGISVSVFRTSGTNAPILYFNLENIDENLENLKKILSPGSFKSKDDVVYIPQYTAKDENFDYKNRPFLKEIKVKKRAVKRYYGCNAYFTRQTWNVVAEYIKNFSQKGDLVLDPFSGSGITGTEALMNGRRSINIDLNPMAVFINKALIAPVNTNEFSETFAKIKAEYIKKEPKTREEIKEILKKYKGCKILPLPKSSDVPTTDKLFTQKQMAQLSLLKSIIKKQKNSNIHDSFLLAFYNTISMCNKTFHEMPSGGWVNFVMYYRYRLAVNPADRNVMEVFESRYSKILSAKKEMEYFINENTINNAQVVKGTATDLSFIENESVDYIYTDPPYGKKIPYLDLSTMWNAWLDLDVSEDDYKLEAIEGGEHNKTKREYNDLISKSIQEMFRVLKFDRWMSFVFAHKDPEFWHLIVDTCERCGFEYVGAVPQKNGQSSFKKWQHPFTVLSGQLIINFRKTKSPKTIMQANLGMNTSELVIQTIEGIVAKNDGATIEEINDEIIIKGMELGFLVKLSKEYSDLTPILLENFDFDKSDNKYKIKKDTRFKSHVDVRLRIKYYAVAYLRALEREENRFPNFDDVVFGIMPMLKNGQTPEHQTILSVLESIADKIDGDRWRLKPDDPQLSMNF